MSALVNQTTSAQPEQSALSVTASTGSASLPWWGIFLIVLAIAVALIVAGVLGYGVFKRKKKLNESLKKVAELMKEEAPTNKNII